MTSVQKGRWAISLFRVAISVFLFNVLPMYLLIRILYDKACSLSSGGEYFFWFVCYVRSIWPDQFLMKGSVRGPTNWFYTHQHVKTSSSQSQWLISLHLLNELYQARQPLSHG